ncbi:hypothetical protein CDAR_255251 [Caerostris darwini]|uniref:Uncharacterized protein n=1 Tax=Caerostris darwini TaxID=1538125 RepID=A0AAV4V1Q5_9ARAC|nr:hypothetical protein CDAR_255251 [Caerostris darwini]
MAHDSRTVDTLGDCARVLHNAFGKSGNRQIRCQRTSRRFYPLVAFETSIVQNVGRVTEVKIEYCTETICIESTESTKRQSLESFFKPGSLPLTTNGIEPLSCNTR